ncbi:SDR family NAD(P)-dependent oxidoreductase [Litorivivens sp.]|uniref:SDR family NAD(P)-dependent oxidoreductase n=1 Tax=Litorivivens sp. TaxID=2020868 RepID=UPI0035673471
MMNDHFSLQGKVALITGAGNGIGAACARCFAQSGAAVMASDINGERVEALARELVGEGFEVKAIQHDVAKEDDWARVVDALADWHDGWDILVNNAGIYIGGKLEENSLSQLHRINGINIDSIFLGTQFAASAMQPDGRFGRGGSIINLSSIAGLIGVPGHSIYGATKGAVRSLTKHSAVEFAAFGYGIRVNSLHPGLIATEMGYLVFKDFVEVGLASSESEAQKMLENQMIPMGRLGDVQDIALAAQFLASDASSYMTGSELTVDGGFTAT